MIHAHTARISRSSLQGSIAAPASKSHTLRAILFGSLAKGTSTVQRTLKSPDTTAMIEICRQLGASITVSDDCMTIIGVAGQPTQPKTVLDVGNSGIILRFVMGILALLPKASIITGDHSIRTRRVVQPLMDALKSLGANCYSLKGNHYAPLQISGPISPGKTISFDGSDSQTVSALMIAASLLPGSTDIHIKNPGEIPWVGLTCHWLDKLGVTWNKHSDEHYTVHGVSCFDAFDYIVPGDFSTIAFPMVAAVITQSPITITHLDFDDPQGDSQLIGALQRMGANIRCDETSLSVYPSKQLTGIDIDINTMVDTLPALAVVACFAKGTTRLYNAAIARQKECDRLTIMKEELSKLSANITDTEDSLIIQGGPLQAGNLQSPHDHRIGMALSVLALALDEPSTVQNIQCINKTYRHFYKDLIQLGANVELIA